MARSIDDEEFTKNEEKLRRAEQQRFAALKNAFEIIDHYVLPIYDPEMHEKYEQVRQYLLQFYIPQETDWLEMIHSPMVAEINKLKE